MAAAPPGQAARPLPSARMQVAAAPSRGREAPATAAGLGLVPLVQAQARVMATARLAPATAAQRASPPKQGQVAPPAGQLLLQHREAPRLGEGKVQGLLALLHPAVVVVVAAAWCLWAQLPLRVGKGRRGLVREAPVAPAAMALKTEAQLGRALVLRLPLALALVVQALLLRFGEEPTHRTLHRAQAPGLLAKAAGEVLLLAAPTQAQGKAAAQALGAVANPGRRQDKAVQAHSMQAQVQAGPSEQAAALQSTRAAVRLLQAPLLPLLQALACP